MHVKRIVALGVAGGALAAWLAAASTTGRRPIADVRVPTSTPVEVRGAELAAEIARLRERLRPAIAPQAPTRNLFEFSRGVSRPRGIPVPQVTAVAEDSAPVSMPPPLKLIGIAEDPGPDGVVRTAIISEMGQLFFAKSGDRVAERYQVSAISGEAAQLIDLRDNSTFTIVLK